MIELNRKILLSLIAGLLFSCAAFYLTFINIPLQDLSRYITTINYWWAIPSLLVALLSYVIRVARWQIILAPVKKTGFWSAFHPLVIGFMINCVFPGRIGEIARPAIFYKRENVAFSKVLATVAMERIFDLITMLVFFIVTMSLINVDPNLDITFAGYHLTSTTLKTIWITTLQMSAVLLAILILISFSRTRAIINRGIIKFPDLLFFTGSHFRDRIREGLCRKIVHILEHIAVGFEVVKNPGDIIVCLIQSFIMWAMITLPLLSRLRISGSKHNLPSGLCSRDNHLHLHYDAVCAGFLGIMGGRRRVRADDLQHSGKRGGRADPYLPFPSCSTGNYNRNYICNDHRD